MEKSGKKSRKVFIFGFLITLIAVSVFFFLHFPSGKQAASPVEYDYVKEKARELEFNVEKIISFVKNDIAHEEYTGYLRGAVGTLWSGAGNSVDRSVLLMELLKCAKTETRLIKNGMDYFVEYKKGGEWIPFAPYENGKSGQLETLNSIPEGLKHKLEIIVRCYGDKTNYKDDIIYKDDTAFFVHRKNALEFKRGATGKLTANLICGRKVFDGKEDIGKAAKLLLIFNIYSADRKTGTFTRTVFDIDRQAGHLIPNQKDKFVFAVLPNFVNKKVLEIESGLFHSNRSLLSGAEQSVFKNFLLNIGFAVLSDKNTADILNNLKGKAYFTSPRIIISSSEFDNPGGKETENTTIDLLKNDIEVFSSNGKEINTLRGIGDNVIEGEVLSFYSGEESLTTVNIFRRLPGKDYRRASDTVYKRLAWYHRNLDKLADEKKDTTLIISTGDKSIRIQNNFPAGQNAGKGLAVLVDEKTKTELEKNLAGKIKFAQGKGTNDWVLDCGDKDAQGLSFLLEEIFAVGLRAGINYEPSLKKEVTGAQNFKFTRSNQVNYRVKIKDNEYKVTAYLKEDHKGDDSGVPCTYFLMEWSCVPGETFGRAQVVLPSYIVFGVKDLQFTADLKTVERSISFGLNTSQYSLVGNSKHSQEDFSLLYNGTMIVLPATVITDNKGTRIWYWNDRESLLVLKVESPGYSHEIISVNNGELEKVLAGKITAQGSGAGIDNATASLSAAKLSGTSWGDGSFEIKFNRPLYLFKNSFLVLVDDSGSMGDALKSGPKGPSKFKLAQDAASYLFDHLPADSEMMCMGFYFSSYSRHFTINKPLIKETLAKLVGQAGTPLTGAVYEITKRMKLNSCGNNKIVILLSDGENTDKGETMAEAYKKCGYALPFYTIGFDIEEGGKAEKELQEIALISGGKYLRAENYQQLENAFSEFSRVPEDEENKDVIIVSADGYRQEQREVSLKNTNQFLEFSLTRESPSAGKPKVLFVTRDNLPELEALNIRKQAKDLIKEAVTGAEEIVVIVPAEMVDFNPGLTIGWWQLYPTSGMIAGRTEDGLYGANASSLVSWNDPKLKEISKSIQKGKDFIKEFQNPSDPGLGSLKAYGSFVSGMYCQAGGVLEGVAKAEFESNKKMSLAEWTDYVDQEAFAFSDKFLGRYGKMYDKEQFRRGMLAVSGTFKSDYSQLVKEEIEKLRDAVEDKVKEMAKDAVKDVLKGR